MEREFLDWLISRLPASPHLRLGAGDDAAVLNWSRDADVVVTTDAIMEGVDFFLAEIDVAQAGYKALAVNLSDLAAMAAEPVAAVISLVLPRDGAGCGGARQLAEELYRGMLPLAERFGLAIAGGDTNTWAGPLAISVTALGRTTERGPLTRSGARPGDDLLITGAVGGSILGRHLHVEPRVREALVLHDLYPLHAGIDVSDGLALDASRLAAASRCGVALELDAIPISTDALRLAHSTGRLPIDHALGDGEDFELLLAASPEAADQMVQDQPIGVAITKIGSFVEEPGLWKVAGGGLEPLAPTGYEH